MDSNGLTNNYIQRISFLVTEPAKVHSDKPLKTIHKPEAMVLKESKVRQLGNGRSASTN